MFGFPHCEHEQFSRNFLRSVIFQIGYDEIITFEDAKVISLFEDKFPRVNKNISKGFQISIRPQEETPILQAIENKPGIEMKSADGQKVLVIDRTNLTLTISGKAYQNFQSFTNHLVKINEFFEKFGITRIGKIGVRKINIIDFKVEGNPSDVLQQIITSELCSNLSMLPNSEFIKQNIQNLVYQNGLYRMNFRYGLNIPPIKSDIGQIILDIDLINQNIIDAKSTIKSSTEMNQEIFNVFMWAINENTKQILKTPLI